MIRITIACPEAYISAANQLARVLGYGEADEQTFGEALYQDEGGNRYAVASGLVRPVFTERAFEPLSEPEWGADMEAASGAQAILRQGTDEATSLADPAHIVAVVHDDPQSARALMGLSQIPHP